MARIRYLKVGFYENEDLAGMSAHHRLTFAGLWLLADREGRLEDRPKRIHAKLFPYEPALEMDQFLHDLAATGFIARYAIGDLRVIQVLNFLEHQRPRHDEPASVLPAQPTDALGTPLVEDQTLVSVITPKVEPAEPVTKTATNRTLPSDKSPLGIGMGSGIGMGRGMGGPHTKHAMCGRVCLHEAQFSQFCGLLGSSHADPDGYVRQFFRDWMVRYDSGDRAAHMPESDMFEFWRARWRETHPPTVVAQTSGDLAAKALERIKADEKKYGSLKR